MKKVIDENLNKEQSLSEIFQNNGWTAGRPVSPQFHMKKMSLPYENVRDFFSVTQWSRIFRTEREAPWTAERFRCPTSYKDFLSGSHLTADVLNK